MSSRITVVCGHYGCGKTNLALNLAVEAASKGRRSVIVDMDIVNPYFRSSEYGPFLERHGVQLIAPVFANTTLDTPVLPPEIYSIFSMEDADVFIDAGGDDVGATALGRISRELEAAGYEMLYVVNRYRILSTKPEETLPLLREIEGASHLKATAVVNNSHLGVDTTQQTVLGCRGLCGGIGTAVRPAASVFDNSGLCGRGGDPRGLQGRSEICAFRLGRRNGFLTRRKNDGKDYCGRKSVQGLLHVHQRMSEEDHCRSRRIA